LASSVGWPGAYCSFPALGRGLFASGTGLGARPALFSLAMLLTYSIIMGIAYSTLNQKSAGGSDFS
jgi:hypothetical protein